MNNIPTLKEFLAKTNRKCYVRVFSEGDYSWFLKAIKEAEIRNKNGLPFYHCDNMGGVANAYKWAADTARWGVWIDPIDKTIHLDYGRIKCYGRNVACSYYGGEKKYASDWRKWNPTGDIPAKIGL